MHRMVIADDANGVALLELEHSFETQTLALKLIWREIDPPGINVTALGVSLTARQALELSQHLLAFAVRCAQ